MLGNSEFPTGGFGSSLSESACQVAYLVLERFTLVKLYVFVLFFSIFTLSICKSLLIPCHNDIASVHVELLSVKGKPTESMLEARQLEYGELDVKDYLPGAEILKTDSQTDAGREQNQGNTRKQNKQKQKKRKNLLAKLNQCNKDSGEQP